MTMSSNEVEGGPNDRCEFNLAEVQEVGGRLARSSASRRIRPHARRAARAGPSPARRSIPRSGRWSSPQHRPRPATGQAPSRCGPVSIAITPHCSCGRSRGRPSPPRAAPSPARQPCHNDDPVDRLRVLSPTKGAQWLAADADAAWPGPPAPVGALGVCRGSRRCRHADDTINPGGGHRRRLAVRAGAGDAIDAHRLIDEQRA